jgi:hypothetical protein
VEKRERKFPVLVLLEWRTDEVIEEAEHRRSFDTQAQDERHYQKTGKKERSL